MDKLQGPATPTKMPESSVKCPECTKRREKAYFESEAFYESIVQSAGMNDPVGIKMAILAQEQLDLLWKLYSPRPRRKV